MKLMGIKLPLALLRGAMLCASLAAALPAAAEDNSALESDNVCGALTNGFGPHDYVVNPEHRPIVESAHFTPWVERLERGNRGTIGADLDYTLRAFPNHHRALLAMMRYGEKLKTNKVNGAKFSVECYFERALRWRPLDTIARGLYVTYLQHQGRTKDALRQVDAMADIIKDSPLSYYNVGLMYLELGEPAKALSMAQRAYGQDDGLPPALKNKLKSAGKWVEPAPNSKQDAVPGTAPQPATGTGAGATQP